ncbi:hypothetical protein CKO38_08880 [Rhodospirillum rubrum]|uniref:hypothetical protein n=1 Tax=Rhodospirillum rubrum TaxID=1085 RepID=UPI001904C931|nr:hypothetical protein [Rhodospirillum rubrum]MBK1664337.1 hypothetical protein [Rhodospirillum rubrum]MBK1676782.1 hypothetical protein [Rhodospirillum rubrum]
MSVTNKVTGASSAFSAAANTRLGEGIRAATASQSFAPILEIAASAQSGPEESSLRNNDWGGTGAEGDVGKDTPSALPNLPVRMGSVLASNSFSQILFDFRVREPSRSALPIRTASREGTDVYQSNIRVLAARFSGEKMTGTVVNRFY